jgi:hypothetical protein
MYSQIMHIIVIIYQISTIINVGMNTIFNKQFQIYLLTYFYNIKILQILYLLHHKHNGGTNDSIFLLIEGLNLHSFVNVANCLWILDRINFLVYFTMLASCILYNNYRFISLSHENAFFSYAIVEYNKLL